MDEGTLMSLSSTVSITVSMTVNESENSTSPFPIMFDEGIDRDAFYGKEFDYFHDLYRSVHGYLSLAVCVFGIIANFLNIIVLTRKEMISPTNALLTGMAVTDMFVIASYIPFAIHNFIRVDPSPEVTYAYGWAIFTLFHAHFTVVCHTISIWLTVILAVLRYLAVSSLTNNKTWCSMSKARWAILLTYIIVPAFCLPLFLSFTITKFHIEESPKKQLYRVDFSDIATSNDELLQKVNFWVFSVLTKLVPCILLTYLSLALIRVLVEANRRKQRLQSKNLPLKCTDTPLPNMSLKRETERQKNASQQQSDRTTKMLIAILIMFLICEFPSGILALLSGIFGKNFFRNVYNNFGDLMDMLALINSAVNFILYCLMSQQFRNTFSELFCVKIDDSRRHSYALAQNTIEPTCETECV